MTHVPATRVRNHSHYEWPDRDGHLDVYELTDGSVVGYLTATDPLVGRLVDHPVQGAALDDLVRQILNEAE